MATQNRTNRRGQGRAARDVGGVQQTGIVIDEQTWKAKRGEIAVELAKVLLGRISLSNEANLEKLPALAVKLADRLMVQNFNLDLPTFQVQEPAAPDGETL